jgi:hypothetical protein
VVGRGIVVLDGIEVVGALVVEVLDEDVIGGPAGLSSLTTTSWGGWARFSRLANLDSPK